MREDWIKLSLIKGVGEVRMKELISHFGSPERVFNAPYEEIVGLSSEKVARSIKGGQRIDVTKQMEVIDKLDVKILTFIDDEYPENLKNLQDSPPLLYVRGDLKTEDNNAIAIVGSRRATVYGKLVAERFASEFARAGVTVVSGMARGIDSSAHKSTLKNGGRTIAVFGCGIERIYPPENKELMHEIIRNGACVSEFPIGTLPLAGNFPTRNRIISGLSRAVVVIEATMHSGTFSTVEWALEQAKDVFAVPGNVTSPMSMGTNKLILDGAKPVTAASDVLDFLGIHPGLEERVKQINLSGDEKKVFESLSYDPIQIDELSENLHIQVSKVSAILLTLELKEIVRQLPGRYFIKVKG